MKAYAIKDPKGRLSDFKQTSTASRRSFCFQRYWKHYYKEGYRCVPVLITEVKTDK